MEMFVISDEEVYNTISPWESIIPITLNFDSGYHYIPSVEYDFSSLSESWFIEQYIRWKMDVIDYLTQLGTTNDLRR